MKHTPSVVCSFFTESKFTWKHALAKELSATTFHKILLKTKTNAYFKCPELHWSMHTVLFKRREVFFDPSPYSVEP